MESLIYNYHKIDIFIYNILNIIVILKTQKYHQVQNGDHKLTTEHLRHTRSSRKITGLFSWVNPFYQLQNTVTYQAKRVTVEHKVKLVQVAC